MLLALLLHVLIFHLLTARDVPARKDTEYVIQHIDTCPNVGYYFMRQPSANTLEPATCFLCFCQQDNTAICWKRDNRRCNAQSFQYHAVGKSSDTRIRRSPGFADIFFRDAARDVFNKNGKQDCKPFESSFSDDCPPVDWCIGCTVCDCDANGHWDCHVLSFCPDGKGKKKTKRKGSVRTVVAKKPVKKSKVTSNIPKRTPPSAAKKTKPVNKAKSKSAPRIKRKNDNNISQQPRKRIFKKSVPFNSDVSPSGPPKRRSPIRYKRILPLKSDSKKEMIIKKNVGTHKPIDIGSTKVNLEMEIAKKVMQKVMTNIRQSIDGEMKNISKMANKIARNKNAVKRNVKNFKKPNGKPKTKPKPAKKVNKRQAKKSQRKPPPKSKKPMKKPNKKPMKKPMKKSTKQPIRRPTSKKYVRNKRNVKMVDDFGITPIVAQGTFTESKNHTAPYSVTSNLLVPDHDNCSVTSVGSSTLGGNEYYKYVVGIEEPNVTADEVMGYKRTTSQVNRTETVFNLIGTQITPMLSTEKSQVNKDETFKINNSSEINPDANDLKYSKWSHLKILKEKKLKSASDKHLNLVKFITNVNQSILEDYKNKVHGKDVERKVNSRKYNIIKLLSRPKCIAKRDHSDNSTDFLLMDVDLQKGANKIGDLQSLLGNILREYHNSTTNPPKKYKKFNILRYLKRFFNKIFRRKKYPNKFNKHHLIDTLCENFGPCKVSRRDKVLLNAKLTELDQETQKILKTVKIIKGLLKLVELPKSADADLSNQDSFRNDMNKLNNILKGTYVKHSQQSALSLTQITQIEYVKKNTQDFIQSVTKFASLLNEIIIIITKHNKNTSKNRNRLLRNNIFTKNITKEDPFQSLKHLLIRYNLIQNSFMKRMYEQLNNFENKMNEKPKVSEVKDFNNSVAIEDFSRNIIQNLRKLKRLAQNVSSSGRSKREAMRDDDAIEYLLMLMEYMLKQNHPLDVAPVNDGIDLLIEAIKNAPDIKPIKKKVLEYTSTTYSDVVTTPVTNIITTDTASSDDDSPSDSEKSSSEDSGRLKLEDTDDTLKNKIEENKELLISDQNKELVEMIAEDDKDPEDKYQYDRKVGIEKGDDITEIAFYNRVEDNIIQEPEAGFETTTALPLQMEMSDKLDEQEDNMEKEIAIEHNNLDKPVADAGTEVDDKKFEVFTADMDEELILPGTSTTPVTDISTTMTTELTTQPKKSRSKMRRLNLESFDSESIDKKSKLEWIEENFRRENEKEFTDFEEFNTTLSRTVTVTPKTVPSRTTDKIDVSSLTRENFDEADKKNKAKINAEEVMLRKQMELLNSLDYGTEKTELYESDSKDGNGDDRYSSDTFPSYFV